MAGRTPRTPKTRAHTTAKRDWKPEFLEAFESTGLVTEACKLAQVGRRTVYDHRESDEEFAAAWAELEESTVERMEQEALRRAVEGVKRETYDKDGNLIRDETVYSDTLLIFLLKARRPGVYRENVKVEHTGPGGGAVRHEVQPIADEETSKLAHELLERFGSVPREA